MQTYIMHISLPRHVQRLNIRLLHIYGESNVVISPAFIPGTGKTRTLNALFQRPANAATSRINDVKLSCDTLPGTGTVSTPTPHTELIQSNLSIVSL